jgi:hypothetical protein
MHQMVDPVRKVLEGSVQRVLDRGLICHIRSNTKDLCVPVPAKFRGNFGSRIRLIPNGNASALLRERTNGSQSYSTRATRYDDFLRSSDTKFSPVTMYSIARKDTPDRTAVVCSSTRIVR